MPTADFPNGSRLPVLYIGGPPPSPASIETELLPAISRRAVMSLSSRVDDVIEAILGRLERAVNEECQRCRSRFLKDLKANPLPDKTERALALKKHFAAQRPKFISDARLVLDEALTNHVKHGNKWDPGKRVTVNYEHDQTSGDFIIRSRDEGQGFDPDAVPDPTSPERLEEENGRGVYLIKALSEAQFGDDGRAIEMRIKLREKLEDHAAALLAPAVRK